MFSVLNKIEEKLAEATAMANISYLPTELGKVRKAIKDLSKKKEELRVDVLEDQGGRILTFDNELRISVSSEHWQDFIDKVFMGWEPMGTFGFPISEDVGKQFDHAIKRFREVLLSLESRSPLSEAKNDIQVFTEVFQKNNESNISIALRYNHFIPDVENIIKQVKTRFMDDIGFVEMVTDALGTKRPVGVYEVFSGYDNIYGGLITARDAKVYKGKLSFEALIDNGWTLHERIYMEDRDVLEALVDEDGTVKIVKNQVFPVGGRFRTNFFWDLEEIIDHIA